MKKIKYLLLILIISLMLAACGNPATKDPDSNISIEKNGSVEAVIIDSFEQSYYNLDELKTMIDTEIDGYNQVSGKKIELKKLSLDNDIVRVIMSYDSTEDYAAFNSQTLFVGSYDEAVAKGYSMNVILSSAVNPSQTISEPDIKAFNKEKIVITDAAETIYVPGKILYISDNATVLEGAKSAKSSGLNNGLIYIVYK